jgi:subtilase family serine protease
VNGPTKLVAPLLVALAVAACSSGGSSNVPATGQALSFVQRIPDWQANKLATRVCNDMRVGYAHCDALLLRRQAGPATVAGWTAPDLESAYNLTSSLKKGKKQIVGIVDAYDNPNAASDLATYRTEFSLGTAKFTKYNQDGQQGNYPSGDANWGLEEDLDIQMVSASCPKCTIYLVEANGADTSDLETAEAEAVKLGATIVSNSWGCTGSNECLSTSYFDSPGVAYLASAGDGGYGTQAPAALASVIAVGGTVLSQSGSKWTQVVWVDSGAGCATGITKPSWQTDPKCTYRTMNDVSAVSWNAAEYDSYDYSGWITVGGTSVSSPFTAGVIGLAGNASKQNGGENFWNLSTKAKAKDFLVITGGSVIGCPSEYDDTYMCEAGTNEYGQYSAPSGWGTPNGIKAY